MARTKTQVILRYLVYGVVSIAVLSLVGYFLIIRPLQINKEKANFTKAETQLDALAAQIEKTIGKADDQKKEKSCGFASRVYERGPRGCGISIYMLYKNKGLVASQAIMSQASNLIGTQLYGTLGEKTDQGFKTYSGRGPGDSFSQDLKPISANISCSAEYTYPVVALFDKQFQSLAPENIQISLVCGGSAMSEYFTTIKQ